MIEPLLNMLIALIPILLFIAFIVAGTALLFRFCRAIWRMIV